MYYLLPTDINICRNTSAIFVPGHSILDFISSLSLSLQLKYTDCQHTTREQTLERCPNLALASAFFAPGSPGW